MPIDELTKLGIRLTNVDERLTIAFSQFDKTKYDVEDTLNEIKEILRAWKEEKRDMENKINVIAKAVKKLAKEQGRLPSKSKER
jgi:hypothetical protein